MLARIRLAAAVGGLVASLWLIGCTGALQGLFAEEFLGAIGGGSSVASVPGDAPALLVAVENRTDRIVEADLSYRSEGTGVETVGYLVSPGDSTAQALICPIEELTLGDVADSSAVGARVRLGDGGEYDPYIEVEPFGVIMREGSNFDCGDSIVCS